MRILCAFGRYNYGDPERGEGYEYCHFLPALRNLGHEVLFFDSWDRRGYTDYAGLNQAFLETVWRWRPDVVLCVTILYELWLETVALARRSTDTVFVHWNPDDSWKYGQSSRFLARVFDLMATTYASAFAQAQRDGYDNFVLTQWAANSASLAEPLPAESCRYAVSFVGSAYGNRPDWVAALQQAGIEVACFGHGWDSGPVAAEEIPRIIRQSRISLNFSDSGLLLQGLVPRRSRQLKARVFEVPGAGGCLATEDAPGVERYFVPGQEILVFRDRREMVAKVGGLLASPGERDRVAAAGVRRVRREHTYEHRLEELLAQAVARRRPRPQMTAAAAREQFAHIVRRHRRHGAALQAAARLLARGLSVPFGEQRGSRAARRLVFELSWRLAGERTYRAGGWPGRMFFRV